MSSVQIQTFSVEGQQQPLDIEDSGRIQRGEWVLNSPDPPGLCHELIGSIKETVFPHGNKHYSSSSRKRTPWKCAVSFLHALFPILSWGKNYTASNFKNDLMAGLTLASLSIPQVRAYTHKLSPYHFMKFLISLSHPFYEISLQSIGYASLAKLDPQYGLCKSLM
jgi:low affinity sulfate transporter 2